MKIATIVLGLAVILSPAVLPAMAVAKPSIEAANRLFERGKFAEAEREYTAIAKRHPDDYQAALQLGRIGLLGNHLDEAERWLKAASAIRPAEADPKVMLAEAYYRQDRFEEAVSALDGVDVANNKLVIDQYPTLNVAKLQSFKGQKAYDVDGAGEANHIKLLQTTPLPLLNVHINGGREVTFFIDTGGSEVALDSDFAKELGIPQFGSVQGTFAGGQQTPVQQGRIESLGIGDWTIKNLPAIILPLRQFSSGLGAKEIDGVIGTTLFYHFLTTLDFPGNELVLRKKDAAGLKDFLASPDKGIAVPIWMASDHFMIGRGRVESLPPTFLFIDTGLTGAGVKLAENVIKKAGITLDEAKAESGAGGGGALKVVLYTVSRLSFGDVHEKDVAGLYDGPFPWENMFGFELSGMVGHDFFEPHVLTLDFENMRVFIK